MGIKKILVIFSVLCCSFFLLLSFLMRRYLFNTILWSVFQSSYITHIKIYNSQWTSLCVQLSMYCFVHLFLDMWVLKFSAIIV